MKLRLLFALLLCACCYVSFAQTPHSTPESRQKAKDRADYALFRRQATALKEFGEEKKKIAALQKENKEVVKVYFTVDSTEGDDSTKKTITGYITQSVGESANNAYELIFDRTVRKITGIKKTGESMEPEAAEEKEKKAPVVKKADGSGKVPVAKKKKDGEEDDEEEDEKEDKTPASKDKDE